MSIDPSVVNDLPLTFLLGEGAAPPIRIWRYWDAPYDLQDLFELIPPDSWLVLIPAGYAQGEEIVGEMFDFKDEEERTLPDGGVVLLGSCL